MPKKRRSLTVDLQNLSELNFQRLTIENALSSILRQIKAQGLRPRTVSDYEHHVTHFVEVTGATYMDELTAEHIYEWLSSMNVSNQTKLTRLKCLRAFFSRCYANGWFDNQFWRNVRIKVDTPVKEGATDREISALLSLLDLSNFVELRDAVALLLMYQTGIRVGTLVQLENKHVDLETKMLRVDGGLLKNHNSIYLPFDDVLVRLLTALIKQNEIIRNDCKTNNTRVFITIHGDIMKASQSHNAIAKRLNTYARQYDLKHINPHALRRGFAKNLLKKGANIALISKALGHSDIAVTSRYLHLDHEEVVENLRQFL